MGFFFFFAFTDKHTDKQTHMKKKNKYRKQLPENRDLVCVKLSSIGLVILKKVEKKTCFLCFYGQTFRQTNTFEKRIKYRKTIPGLTRIFCVNLSAIGSVILEKVTKLALYGEKKHGQIDRQTEKQNNRSI